MRLYLGPAGYVGDGAFCRTARRSREEARGYVVSHARHRRGRAVGSGEKMRKGAGPGEAASVNQRSCGSHGAVREDALRWSPGDPQEQPVLAPVLAICAAGGGRDTRVPGVANGRGRGWSCDGGRLPGAWVWSCAHVLRAHDLFSHRGWTTAPQSGSRIPDAHIAAHGQKDRHRRASHSGCPRGLYLARSLPQPRPPRPQALPTTPSIANGPRQGRGSHLRS